MERLLTKRKPNKHLVAHSAYNLQNSFVGRYLDPVYNLKKCQPELLKNIVHLSTSVIGILSLKAALISS